MNMARPQALPTGNISRNGRKYRYRYRLSLWPVVFLLWAIVSTVINLLFVFGLLSSWSGVASGPKDISTGPQSLLYGQTSTPNEFAPVLKSSEATIVNCLLVAARTDTISLVGIDLSSRFYANCAPAPHQHQNLRMLQEHGYTFLSFEAWLALQEAGHNFLPPAQVQEQELFEWTCCKPSVTFGAISNYVKILTQSLQQFMFFFSRLEKHHLRMVLKPFHSAVANLCHTILIPQPSYLLQANRATYTVIGMIAGIFMTSVMKLFTLTSLIPGKVSMHSTLQFFCGLKMRLSRKRKDNNELSPPTQERDPNWHDVTLTSQTAVPENRDRQLDLDMKMKKLQQLVDLVEKIYYRTEKQSAEAMEGMHLAKEMVKNTISAFNTIKRIVVPDNLSRLPQELSVQANEESNEDENESIDKTPVEGIDTHGSSQTIVSSPLSQQEQVQSSQMMLSSPLTQQEQELQLRQDEQAKNLTIRRRHSRLPVLSHSESSTTRVFSSSTSKR